MSGKRPVERRRHESSRSQLAEGSVLSDSTCATEEVHESDGNSDSSSQSFNFTSPSDNGSNVPITPANPPENRRQPRVSWRMSSEVEDEETFVKQLVATYQKDPDNSKFDRPNENHQEDKDFARMTRAHSAQSVHTARCPCGRKEFRRTRKKHENESEDKRIIKIHLLINKDEVRTQAQSQKTLRESSTSLVLPTARIQPTRVNSVEFSETGGIQTNRQLSGNGFCQGGPTFGSHEERRRRGNQQRSSSCDCLGAGPTGLIRHDSPINNNSASSSGYEEVDLVDNHLSGSVNRTTDINCNGGIARMIGDGEGTNVDRAESVSLLSSGNNTAKGHDKNKRCNFRKLFYILVAFNTLIVISGFSALFAYMATIDRKHGLCMDCQVVNSLQLEISSFKTENGQCCLDSMKQLFELIVNMTKTQHARNARYDAWQDKERTPMAQYKASRKVTIDKSTRISWKVGLEFHVQKVFGGLGVENNTVINIPVSGFYYIYSHVHYFKDKGEEENSLQFGYSVVHVRDKFIKEIGSTNETCFPTTVKVMHTLHLSFVHEFTKGDTLYLRLENDHRHFSSRNSQLGLFLIQT